MADSVTFTSKQKLIVRRELMQSRLRAFDNVESMLDLLEQDAHARMGASEHQSARAYYIAQRRAYLAARRMLQMLRNTTEGRQ
jgi:hypothetical protein